MVVAPSDRAKTGDTGTLRVFLITPEGKQYTDKIKFRVETASEAHTSGNQAKRFRRRVASRQPTPIPRKLARRMKLEKDGIPVRGAYVLGAYILYVPEDMHAPHWDHYKI